MTRQRLFLLLMALLLIALSWWGVIAARTGLVMRHLERDQVPMLYVAPQGRENLPGVLVAHGFAGSKQLMLGYAHVLAHAGYAVMLWDFGGHGANASPLGRSLTHELDVAYTALLEQPEVEPSLALLGHSMGSGAVMSAAIRNPDSFAATVAVSPTGAQVTRFTPRNLQLQAGSWEGGFVANAQRLLIAAGGDNQNLGSGQGRSLVIIPKAEHITILFRNASHQAALQWLDAAFGRTHTSSYVDRRMLWYGLHLLGWLLIMGVIPLATPAAIAHKPLRPLSSWGGLLVAPLVATGSLTLLSRVSKIQSLGGLMVGGAVGIWFFVAGIVWLSILFRLPRPTLRSLRLGLAFFGLLWVGFGAMAQLVWLQWWLIPPRLLLLPLLSLACFPWFLASGVAQQNAGVGKRLLWWLGQSTVLVGGLFLTLHLLPQLSFIFLLLPLFPPLIGILSYAAAQLKDVWSYALGSALFFGWMLAAAFPLA